MVKIRKLLKIIGINTIILLVLIKIVDLFLPERNISTIQNNIQVIKLAEHLPNADFTIIPIDDYIAKTENLIQKPYRVRTDSNGFIIGPNNIINKNDSIEIIFFGGSTTECLFVDEENRFPYLVGEILSKKNGKQIIVRNAGVSGRNTIKSTIDLIGRGIPLHPRIVVLMENVNDLSQLVHTGSYFEGPNTRAIFLESEPEPEKPYHQIFRSLKNIVFPNLYRLLKSIIRHETTTIDEWEGWKLDRKIDYYYIEKQYTNAILSFINFARVYNIEVVLMTQCNRMNLNDSFIVNDSFNANNRLPPELFNYYALFNEKIRDIARGEGILLIDLADRIPSNSNYIYDAVHLNNAGSVLAAEIIAEEIESKFYKLNN
jgi:lysophospholipase L1-like esterase